jgi:A/G-specific adenine glycosylase
MWTLAQRRAIPRLLLEWYQHHARPMPWHENPTPYLLLVAATMLQQTQVATVLPYLHRFLERFPTVNHLATAEEEEVLRYWAGLGYYSRARNLHRAAQQIMQHFGGEVPCEPHLLRQLPGVGEYTAGAVASIACRQPEPALDANGYRIVARLLAFDGDITRTDSRRRLWEACRQIIPEDAPGDFNQALMDLGATVCTAREPRCLICPLAEQCLAFQQGKQTSLPVMPPRRASERVQDVCVVVEHGGRWLLVKRTEGQLWRGMWEFPRVRVQNGETLEQAAHRAAASVGMRVSDCKLAATVRHGVMHYSITLYALCVCATGAPCAETEARRWVSPWEVEQLPLPSPMRRLVRALRDTAAVR